MDCLVCLLHILFASCNCAACCKCVSVCMCVRGWHCGGLRREAGVRGDCRLFTNLFISLFVNRFCSCGFCGCCFILFGSDVVYGISIVLRTNLIAELNILIEAILDECDCLVDANRFRKLAVRLQISSFVWCVLQNDIGLRVLIVTQADQYYIALIDPNL